MSRLTLVLDSHTLSQPLNCERLYELSTIQGLQPTSVNYGQSRGTHIHAALYLYYKAKIEKKSFTECVNRGLRYVKFVGRHMKSEDYLMLMRKYAEYCGYYRNENILPLAVEKGFSKILYEDAHYLFIYEGRIDFVGKFHNDPERYWVDHKSEAQKEDLNSNSFQFLGYSWALNTTNGLINYIGFQESKAPNEAFRRTIVSHKKELIQEWKEEAINYYFRIANLHRHGIYQKNRNHCKRYKCSPCVFSEVCAQTNPRMINALLQKDFVKRIKPWRAWD